MNGDSYKSRDGRGHGSSRDHYQSSRPNRDDHRERERGAAPRRRSRSPGHRSSRREYEPDSYSSSRDYREREREDRYSRRDDRGERGGWDRDRGSSRRDYGERPPPPRERADRDLFEDRRGGRRGDREGFGGAGPGGGGGGGGGAAGGRERKPKSASPPPKKKEPTPDLTDVAPITERRRRLTQWDIKPPGYENVTSEQAKLSGMFPLPGAPRQQPLDPSRLQAMMSQPAGSASNAALQPSNARQSKRLFVYNIPASSTDASINDFFNIQLNGLNVVTGVDPCLAAQIGKDHEFALLDFKTAEDATVALALDGITMEADDVEMSNGVSNGDKAGLSIRRPKDYIVPATSEGEDEVQPGVVSSVVRDNPNKISVTSLPIYLTDEQVTELLVSFGELKAFILAKDTGTEQSKGIAFCEYVDPNTTDVAVEGLNGMELGDQHLKVKRASIGVTQAAGLEMSVNAMSMLAGTQSNDLEQGRVLQLLNMITAEELMDNEEYAEICEDVKEECEKYGSVDEMKIPRPSGGSRQSAGVGKIYVKYDAPESAQKALKALAGRKFADRTVVVTFFGEEYFDLNAW